MVKQCSYLWGVFQATLVSDEADVITATLTAISCSNLSTFISMKFDKAANLLCVCVRFACVQLDPI